MQQLTREGPGVDEVQIIGVELAVTPPNGGREVELDMFSCRHTIPSPHRDRGAYYGRVNVRVTLHTSIGDFTLLGQPPW